MKKLSKYLFRIIAALPVFIFLSISALRLLFNIFFNFIRYGGEVIAHNKDTKRELTHISMILEDHSKRESVKLSEQINTMKRDHENQVNSLVSIIEGLKA